MTLTGFHKGSLARMACILAACFLGHTAPAQPTNGSTKVRLQLVQSRLNNPVLSESETAPESQFFKPPTSEEVAPEKVSTRKGWFRDVYPGIDLVLYGDDSNLEYVFIVNPGADPSSISFQLEGQTSTKQSHAGNIDFGIPNGEVNMAKPAIFIEKDGKSQKINSGLNTSADGITIDLRAYQQEKSLPLNGSQFNLVKGGGQPGGPAYDFYMSKSELSNDQLLTFLNDMDAATEAATNTTMLFDANGNAWMNPAKQSGTHEMFSIKNSALTFDPTKKPGSRFSHVKDATGKAVNAYNPAGGLSWFGCVKYCNWLTTRAGRGASELCYNEGGEPGDWKPVTSTNWSSGQFNDSERSLWVKKKGIRLPMADSDASNITTNDFSEFYKAAAWDGVTNRPYGTTRGPTTGSKPPANYFGMQDMAATLAEWLNDPAKPGDPMTRAAARTSIEQKLPLSKGNTATPSDTGSDKAVRLVTTFMPQERLFIHVLFSFYMLPKDQVEKATKQEGVDREGVEGTEEGTGGEGGGEGGTQGKNGSEEENNKNSPNGPGDGGGSEIETITSDILPDAVTYTTDPDEAVAEREAEEAAAAAAAATPPATPPSSSGEETPTVVPPVIPPPSEEDEGPHYPTLSVFSSNGVYVTVSSTNLTNSINQATPYHVDFPSNTIITMEAPQYGPNGEVFDHWDCSVDAFDSTSEVITFPMPQDDVSFTAVYRVAVTLTVGSISPDSGVNIQVSAPDILSGQTSGTTEFQRDYWPGTTVTLTAPTNAPGSGNAFHHWVIDGDTTNMSRTITVTVNSDMEVDAVFAPHLLRVRSSGGGDNIAITVFPNDYFGDGSDVTAFDLYYDDNVLVTLTAPATADNGNVFQNWLVDGVNVGTNTTMSVVMNGDHLVTAVYVYMPGTITDPTVSPGGI